MILAGDIGGTKTVLALFQPVDGHVKEVASQTFKSRDYHTFEDILAEFRRAQPAARVAAAAFGVAGPVVEGECRTVNLPWSLISEHGLGAFLKVDQVKLLNDLEATAFGMLHLPAEEMHVLNPGLQPPRRGNAVVIAAGTGLGEAQLIWDGQQYHPKASEGGHTDFGPRNALEMGLLEFLLKEFDHVSYERVVSGPGFYNIYRYLRDTGRHPEPDWVRQRLGDGDPSAAIAEIGLTGKDPLCSATLELFAELYGAEAGNLALKSLAMGGVYVSGGIAPKILPSLTSGAFLRGFLAKGRFAALLQAMPVKVALNPRAPLLGSANYAKRLLQA